MEHSKIVDRQEDPIVDEVRAVREAIDEAVGHDIRKLAERARRIGEEYRREHAHKAEVEHDGRRQIVEESFSVEPVEGQPGRWEIDWRAGAPRQLSLHSGSCR